MRRRLASDNYFLTRGERRKPFCTHMRQTIQNALHKIGFADVSAVRQGKYFSLSLADGLEAEAARTLVERIAREVLTNPVIEEFTYRIED